MKDQLVLVLTDITMSQLKQLRLQSEFKNFSNKFQQPKLKNLEEIIKYYDAPLEHPSSLGLDLICKEQKKLIKS